jgi:hypothetical protein
LAADKLLSNEVRWSEEEAGQVISFLLKNGKLKRCKSFLWKKKLTIK